MTARERCWNLLNDTQATELRTRLLHIGILGLILLNVLAVMLESMAAVEARFSRAFDRFEWVSVAVFSLEYLARLWSCTADPRYAGPLAGRLRFMVSPMALVDLAAILPSYLLFLNLDLRFIRSLRLIRLARLGKLGRYSEASTLMRRVLQSRREELVLSFSVLTILAVICAALMYYAENAAQPDKFSSIPAAMWWAFVTITTVGYGDVFPITTLGRIVGIATALVGILMLALPVGVFSAAFVDEVARRKKAEGPPKCPHCGKSVE